MYALVDANSFYASCEMVFNPHLRNKPVIVLTNNDGCICATNRLAKALNIPKFSPYFKIKQQCEQQNVVVKSSNYELYADLSHKMMNVIGRYASEQYIYSIDESFLHFKNYHHIIDDFHQYATTIRRAVYKETRLPVCVGIAPTPTLAKAANHIAKKLKHYRGVAVITNEQSRIDVLSNMAVGDVWGIGRKISARLVAQNIHTALDLANYPTGLARRNFSIDVEKTVRELNTKQCIHWDAVKSPKKQIYSTRSFGQRIFEKEQLLQSLSEHVSIVARKLRDQSSLVKYMTIFASTSPFDKHPTYKKAFHTFIAPTNDTSVMLAAVDHAIDNVFSNNVAFYRAGIGCLDLVDEMYQQQDLFTPNTDNGELMKCLDHINGRYGANTLKFAAQGIEHKWAMRREFLSPHYTTRWTDIPKINC